jgi:Tfp pilus assembly protein PilO
MNRDRIWVFGTVAAIAIVAVLGYLLGISPIVAQATDATSQASTLTTANAASSVRLTALKSQFADIGTVRKQLAALRTSITTGADISTLIDEVNALCAEYNVHLKSMAVNDATIYVAPVAATPVAPVGTGASTPTPAPTPSATSTAAPTTGSVVPVATASSLVLVPVILNVEGTFAAVVKFAGGVQGGTRLFLVSDLVVNPGGDSSTGSSSNLFSGSITGNVFSIAGVSGDLPGSATPVVPVVPTPTPTPTSIPTVGATTPPTTAPTSTPKP